MGGTGKTPCVLLLAELLKGLGRRPGILTRGYGRGTPDRQLALAPGAAVNAEHSGDEPLIFVRSGRRRWAWGRSYQTGQLLLREFHPDLVLLDDGFQHLRLARNVDMVLIDALNPLGGGLVPLGRLREPVGLGARGYGSDHPERVFGPAGAHRAPRAPVEPSRAGLPGERGACGMDRKPHRPAGPAV